MKKNYPILIALMLFFTFDSFGQGIQAKLLKDMVTITNGKMIIEDFTLISLSNGQSIQIKSYGEAPASGVISRDNFVALFSFLVTHNNDEITKADEGATSKDLEEIIGNADITINIYMGKSGIQMEVKAGNETERDTFKWEDLFKQ